MTSDRAIEILGQALIVVGAIDRHRDQAQTAGRVGEAIAMELLADGVREMALTQTDRENERRYLDFSSVT